MLLLLLVYFLRSVVLPDSAWTSCDILAFSAEMSPFKRSSGLQTYPGYNHLRFGTALDTNDSNAILKWDSNQITKCLSDILMSYQWQIEYCNRITRHYVVPLTCIRSICLYLETSFPGFLGVLSGKKAPFFKSKSQHALGTRLFS